jgi:hypothetical protein
MHKGNELYLKIRRIEFFDEYIVDPNRRREDTLDN